MRFIAMKMATLVVATVGTLLVGAGCDDGPATDGADAGTDGECEIDRECGGGFICEKVNPATDQNQRLAHNDCGAVSDLSRATAPCSSSGNDPRKIDRLVS